MKDGNLGCDIHYVVEQNTGRRKSDKYVGVYSSDYSEYAKRGELADRCYQVFSELASVRGDSPVGLTPRGLPENPSELTALLMEYHDSDAHSVTWFSLEELKQRLEHLFKRESLNEEWENRKWLGCDLLPFSGDVRVIMWFDN